MQKVMRLRRAGATLVLPLRPADELYQGHLLLMQEAKAAIAAGKTGRIEARRIEQRLFVVLFGPDGCRELLNFCGGDCGLALELISPDYDNRIIPALRRRFRREKKRSGLQ